MEYVLGAGDVASNSTGGLTKTGAGALTLSQPSTFTGPLAVNVGTLVANGTLAETAATVAAGATLTGNLNTGGSVTVDGTLAPGIAVGTATGVGALALAGGSTFAMQLADWNGAAGTGYDTADFGSLAITASSGSKLTVSVDATGIANFGESAKSFVIVSADAPPAGLAADNWQVTATGFSGTGTWALDVAGNNLVLNYTPAVAGYSSWIAGFTGLSDITTDGDPDDDGISNLLEYVLNGDPSVSSLAALPSAVISGSDLVLTFVRRAESKTDSTQVIQYGGTLTAWTDLPVPAASAGNIVITPDSPSAGLETVVATIPHAASSEFFARLKATQP
ncbi:autotransporter-associated beta strand repeat-containing protein [Luteolibacter sp. Populi]|uniref:autotransporter-associated beta strand repeat-containing protein n=1 Tax=Luteolibacter sp. Populi TaxID=3230487 RepID=UPI003467DA4C